MAHVTENDSSDIVSFKKKVFDYRKEFWATIDQILKEIREEKLEDIKKRIRV